HVATARPSSSTVHAPQTPSPQPSLTSKIPSVFRSISSSVSPDRTSTSLARPLIIIGGGLDGPLRGRGKRSREGANPQEDCGGKAAARTAAPSELGAGDNATARPRARRASTPASQRRYAPDTQAAD